MIDQYDHLPAWERGPRSTDVRNQFVSRPITVKKHYTPPRIDICLGLNIYWVQSRHLCQIILNTLRLSRRTGLKTIGSLHLVYGSSGTPLVGHLSRCPTQKPRYVRLLDHVIFTTRQWPIDICVLASEIQIKRKF